MTIETTTDEAIPFDLITELPADQEAESYDAGPQRRHLSRRKLPAFVGDPEKTALRYRPSKELLLHINMALHTGSPLLLTGEAGTGKTRAADFVGAYFGIPVHKFVVKSTSVAQDMMYEFDAVGYLHWAHAAGSAEAKSADRLVAETEAIRRDFLHKCALWRAYDVEGDSVLLIDEIDKAPRDFPNDLLHELDRHSFSHPFLHDKIIKPKSGKPPIVIVTSNEERRLPDAFLRRCIFHRIELTPKLVQAAVESMAGEGEHASFPRLDKDIRDIAQKRFWEIRDKAGLEKPPTTAELLTWLSILSAKGVSKAELEDSSLSELPAIGALVKDAADKPRLG